jgi:hypothetical protein
MCIFHKGSHKEHIPYHVKRFFFHTLSLMHALFDGSLDCLLFQTLALLRGLFGSAWERETCTTDES